jgi:hypothetical protein
MAGPQGRINQVLGSTLHFLLDARGDLGFGSRKRPGGIMIWLLAQCHLRERVPVDAPPPG